MKYKAVVIGCGRIGALFDTPEAEAVLTHAHAFSRHPMSILKGVMDINPESARIAGERWHCNSYSDLDELLTKEKPEIISICVPDEYHSQYLDSLAAYKPQAVIAEKPLTTDINRSREIVSKYREKGIPLFVNYPRRFDKTVQEIRKDISCGIFGQILQARIIYTKGLLHNGSHAIDIANYLFGPMLSSKPLSAVLDYSEEDPTISAFLSYEKCPDLFLTSGDERAYSIFEVDIVGEKKRVLFEQFGFKYTGYMVRNDPVFEGYKDIERGPTKNTGIGTAMLNLIENVIRHLEKKEDIICSGADALQSQIICDNLLKEYLKDIQNA